jgi:hypothetical protein
MTSASKPVEKSAVAEEVKKTFAPDPRSGHLILSTKGVSPERAFEDWIVAPTPKDNEFIP